MSARLVSRKPRPYASFVAVSISRVRLSGCAVRIFSDPEELVIQLTHTINPMRPCCQLAPLLRREASALASTCSCQARGTNRRNSLDSVGDYRVYACKMEGLTRSQLAQRAMFIFIWVSRMPTAARSGSLLSIRSSRSSLWPLLLGTKGWARPIRQITSRQQGDIIFGKTTAVQQPLITKIRVFL